jgi:hypothetical protein
MIRNFQAGTVKLWQGGTTDKICMADNFFRHSCDIDPDESLVWSLNEERKTFWLLIPWFPLLSQTFCHSYAQIPVLILSLIMFCNQNCPTISFCLNNQSRR